jgi:SAM-dependent methyltransferase
VPREGRGEAVAAVRVLNLGSGKRQDASSAVSVDIASVIRPDVLHDLNKYPWPFEDDTFDAVRCIDVVEHLDDIVKAMEEIHRVSRSGGRVTITTPHFSCANSYTDPTHRHHLGFFSFDYFTGENQWDFYTRARFRKVKADLVFYPRAKNKLVWRVANHWPAFYEEHLAWILPAWYMHFELEVVK